MRQGRRERVYLYGAACMVLAFGLALSASPVSAQSSDRIRILIGYPPAGGHDLEARVIGRHLPKYLPGSPTIIVQNMPGAGGMIQGAYMYNRGKPDGSVLAIFGSSHIQANILGAGVEYDVGKMPILWAVRSVRVGIAREFLGAKSAKDLTKVDSSKISVAGRSKIDSSCVMGTMGLTLLGVKDYNPVCAYPGTAVIKAAMERGEASFFEASAPHFVGGGAFVELYKKNMVVQMWQSGETTDDGKIVRSKTVHENTPTFAEVYRQVRGKNYPAEPLAEAHKILYNDVHTTLTRTLVLPPGTPPDVVNRLRTAIGKMSDDPAFVKDWERVLGVKFADSRVSPLQAQKITDEFMKPAPWQAELKKFLDM